MPNLAIVKPQPGDEVTSTWGQSVANGMNGIQSGLTNITTTAAPSTTLTVTFPRAFTAPPNVVCTALTGAGTVLAFAQAPSATQVVLGVCNRDGGNLTAGQVVGVQWLAIGVPA